MKIRFLILFLISFTFLSCSEDKYNFYNTCSEIDFEENQWVPKFLKTVDCQNIALYHNLDTNEIWGKFYTTDDLNFENENSTFKINNKTKKRLNKIGLENNYIVLRTEDINFNIKIFFQNSNKTIVYFYGTLR